MSSRFIFSLSGLGSDGNENRGVRSVENMEPGWNMRSVESEEYGKYGV